jgi:DNA-binding MarR family transcriptional regulator
MPSKSSLGPPLLGALMRMPVDAIRARMLSALHEHGFTDLIPAHLIVLRYPGPNGRRPGEIAARSGMSKQAVNYLLGQLEESGYLTRVDDQHDRRSKRIHTTARGDAAINIMRATVAAVEQEFVGAFGADELDALRTLLTHLNVVLGTQSST